jgi:hypothetical protein
VLDAPLGRAHLAVAPFAPEPPYRLYAADGHEPVEVPDTASLVKGGEEVTALVAVKPRPVLIITEPSFRYNEVLALRLWPFGELTVDEREAVREGEAEDLFHLRPDSFKGLEEESAARISSSLRLPLSAVDLSEPLGSINENELRVIHERLVRIHDLDLRNLILGKAQELVESLRSNR